MMVTGSSLDAAISSETVLEKPTWKSPLSTAGVIAAPPSASCGSIFRFWSSKKPLLHAEVERRDIRDRDHAHAQRGLLGRALTAATALVVVAAARRDEHRRDPQRRQPSAYHHGSSSR